MPAWWIKAIAQKMLAQLPMRHRWQYLWQRHVSGALQLSESFWEDRLAHGVQHLQAYVDHSGRLPAKVLELGTGWYPIVPLSYALCGVQEIITVDATPHLRQDLLEALMDYVLEQAHSGRLAALLPMVDPQAIETLHRVRARGGSMASQLQELGITAWVRDARQLPFPDHSLDLVSSNNTFEHIAHPVLRDLLQEFWRVLSPTGVMSHYVDMVDHYTYFDPGIPAFHYLRFSESQWRWIENALQSQNRLRITQYRELYRELGIPLDREINEPYPEAALPSSLAPPFASMKKDELRIAYSYLITLGRKEK